MKYLIPLIFLTVFFIPPAYAQEEKNPSLHIETIEISAEEFNKISRDAVVVQLDKLHAVSWQATIDNNLLYANPDGNAALKIYDKEDLDRITRSGKENCKLCSCLCI